jgi:hypothetical protein
MTNTNHSSLVHDVLTHFEAEASRANHYLDTATLYKFLLYVPSDALVEYLFTIYGDDYPTADAQSKSTVMFDFWDKYMRCDDEPSI